MKKLSGLVTLFFKKLKNKKKAEQTKQKINKQIENYTLVLTTRVKSVLPDSINNILQLPFSVSNQKVVLMYSAVSNRTFFMKICSDINPICLLGPSQIMIRK